MVIKKYDWVSNQLSGLYGSIGVKVSTDFEKRMWLMKIQVQRSDFVSTGPGQYVYQDVLLCVHHMSDTSLDKLKKRCEEFIEKCQVKYKRT